MRPRTSNSPPAERGAGAKPQAWGDHASTDEIREASVLEVSSLTVSYATRSGRVLALRDVNFSIAPGETLALVGESGSGKSTVALAIMGLLAREASLDAGTIRFAGRDLAHLTAAQRHALRGDRIAIVLQDPFTSLNPSLPIGLQVGEPLVFHQGMAPGAALDKAIAALAEVGLPKPAEVARLYPHQLSGGMQQRAVIATALICAPDLVILDEPTTALDVTVEAEILDLLSDLRRRRCVSMLFITHNLGLVNRICDTVGVLYAGSMLEYGPTSDVLRRPAHPYSGGLLASMPRLDAARRRRRLAPIAGKFPDLTRLPSGCIFHPRCNYAEATCREAEQALIRIDSRRQVRCWKSQAIRSSDAASTALHAETAPPLASNAQRVLLEVQNLYKVYSLGTRIALTRRRIPGTRTSVAWPRLIPRRVSALSGVSLSVFAGETLGLVGESGCGKSTLGRTLVRLLDASSGSIRFEGRDIGRAGPRQLRSFRRRAQIVFQNPVSSLNPRKTVGATIGRALMNFSTMPRTVARVRVSEILGQVGLAASYAERFPHQLSGGERQRVGIARALATGPKFVVCDEPVSALDVSVQATVLNLLADLRDKLGLAYLFISHDLSVVAHIADRVAVMYAGVICEEGPTAAVLAPPYHPYTEMLLSAIPSADPARPQGARVRARSAPESSERASAGCCFAHRCPRSLGRICEQTPPPTIEAAQGHRIACHLPLEALRQMVPVLPID